MHICVADPAVIVSRRDQGLGNTEGAGYRRRANLHNQQRPRRLPQRASAAAPRQGRHQHLRSLRPEPARFLPLLLSRLQGPPSSSNEINPNIILLVRSIHPLTVPGNACSIRSLAPARRTRQRRNQLRLRRRPQRAQVIEGARRST